jgi:hypothetical protein
MLKKIFFFFLNEIFNFFSLFQIINIFFLDLYFIIIFQCIFKKYILFFILILKTTKKKIYHIKFYFD